MSHSTNYYDLVFLAVWWIFVALLEIVIIMQCEIRAKIIRLFSQISTNVLPTWTTAVLMLCVLTLWVVLVVSAILASVEMV